MTDYLPQLLFFFLAFACSAVLTPLVRKIALQRGQVARPREDRWHTTPTALMGGVAIFTAFALSMLAALLWPSTGSLIEFLPLFLGALFMFSLGLLDDIYHFHPQTKLVGQIVIAAALVFFGFRIDWFGSHTLNTFVSVFWIVGITNAFNLLDNMDGLAVGIAFISSFFLVIITLLIPGSRPADGQLLVLAGFMGVLLGFLLYNFQPASIFMGDSGSLFIGFLLAGITAHQRVLHSSHFLPILMVPVLILFIPILDTGFVSVMRTLFGRSIAQGGTDHSSHRLVAIGLPERKAVLTLYGFSLIGGAIAVVSAVSRPGVFFTCLVIFLLVSFFFWLYLAKVRVYPEGDRNIIEKSSTLTTVWIDFTYKRRIFEVLLDVLLISFAYWLSYLLRFEGQAYGDNFPIFQKSLPIVLACMVLSYFAYGIYRGVWRYTGVADLITYLKAVASGVVLSILILLFAYRFHSFSRTVFAIFWGISLLFLGGSRLSFRLIAESLRRNALANGRRVLIYGAGDKGEFALREIINNQELGLTPVGFIDDDIRKHNSKIKGYPVLGGHNGLSHLLSKHEVNELIVASQKILPENLRNIEAVCEEKGVVVRKLELSIK